MFPLALLLLVQSELMNPSLSSFCIVFLLLPWSLLAGDVKPHQTESSKVSSPCLLEAVTQPGLGTLQSHRGVLDPKHPLKISCVTGLAPSEAVFKSKALEG